VTIREPQVILRMGSHAEKEYVEKMGSLFDGLMLGANLVEATPGASASLAVKVCPKEKGSFYLDPMTYAFGAYVDPETGRRRFDLDWIKSDQKIKGKVVRDFKRSYARLAEQLGKPFTDAIANNRALRPDDFVDPKLVSDACANVVAYQVQRIRREFENDEEFREYAEGVPPPAAVFAPYFYIEPSDWTGWTRATLDLVSATSEANKNLPTHAVICADRSFILNQEFISVLKRELPATGVEGIWLWFSSLDEHQASAEELTALRALVEALAPAVQVFNMHGGYFSLALCKMGMSGIAHGIGYGEQKDVVPVIGQSIPAVRYYLPAVHTRAAVPDIERSFSSVGVYSAIDFFKKVCDCVICKGVIKNDIKNFSEFGETHYSTPTSRRQAQTPAAAKRCRYHYLFCRRREKDWLLSADVQDIRDQIDVAREVWGLQAPLNTRLTHLARWKAALS
jgi:hypothetical protein